MPFRSFRVVPRRRALTVLAVVTAFGLAACTSNTSPGSGATKTVTTVQTPSTASSPGAPSTVSSSVPAPVKPVTKPVHIKLFNEDGSTYGVGMPVIAFFSTRVTSGKGLAAATTATVNGQPVHGGWYFETSSYLTGYPYEAHYRLQTYWPAHAHVLIKIATKGVSAGPGLTFDDSLFSDWSTGARDISVVNDVTHQMTVTTDGTAIGTYPVSLGARDTPTARGIKVIMEKGTSICMRGPGYYECGIKYTQRLTYGGEYLHSAPWNVPPRGHIGSSDSSNGCTNLLPSDAQKLYGILRIGDVVQYPNADGPAMTLGAGYGDWNVSWSEWQTGGLVSPTT